MTSRNYYLLGNYQNIYPKNCIAYRLSHFSSKNGFILARVIIDNISTFQDLTHFLPSKTFSSTFYASFNWIWENPLTEFIRICWRKCFSVIFFPPTGLGRVILFILSHLILFYSHGSLAGIKSSREALPITHLLISWRLLSFDQVDSLFLNSLV